MLLLNVSSLKKPPSGSTAGTLAQQDQQICTTRKIQFSDQRVIFVDLLVEKFSVVLPEDGPLGAETCSSNTVLIYWRE